MSEIRVACPECKGILYHNCHTSPVEEAAEDLLSWVPETNGFASTPLSELFLKEGRRAGWIGKDEDPFSEPFFGSQAWIYALFEKDQARTFQALINNLLRAAGLDPHDVRQRVYAKIEAERTRKQELEERRAALQKLRQDRYAAGLCTRCGHAYNEQGVCLSTACGGTRKRADEVFGKK